MEDGNLHVINNGAAWTVRNHRPIVISFAVMEAYASLLDLSSEQFTRFKIQTARVSRPGVMTILNTDNTVSPLRHVHFSTDVGGEAVALVVAVVFCRLGTGLDPHA